MAKFKVGDVVKYKDGTVAAKYYNENGVRGVIREASSRMYLFDAGGCVFIDTADNENNEYALELVTPEPVASPIRTITKREIVSGTYAGRELTDIGSNYVRLDGIIHYNHELRAAANLFIEIADVLDENAKDAA